MMTPVPKASSYGTDGNDKTNRFHTAMEKDMVLNPAVGKGVMDVPSSGSLATTQKMKNACAPYSLGQPQVVVNRLLPACEWESRRKSNLLSHVTVVRG